MKPLPLVSIVLSFLLLSGQTTVFAQRRPSAFVDRNGVLRWTAGRQEIAEYRIPLADFKRVRVTGPGEKGFVFVDRIPEENHYLDIRNVETVKMAVLPQDNPAGASVFFEYITLESR